MSLLRLIFIATLSLLFILGCAKKKEQAQRLEKEIVGDTSIDSIIETDSVVIDTIESTQIEETKSPVINMPPRPKGVGYTVQIAGCEEETYAMSLVELYQSRGYEPFVVKENIDGMTYYRVRIGMLYSLNDAKLLKKELADLYSVDGWIDYVR